MRPISAGDGLGMQNLALKSGSSSVLSSGRDDDVELLYPCTKKYNLVDAGIITSPRDYLKATNKPSDLFQAKRMDSSPVVAALSKELKRAMIRVHELEHFQTTAQNEVDGLLRRFADEKAFLKTREEEKIQAAVFWIQEELDKERKLRKKMELENRKLSRSLEEANRTVVKAEDELDKEKKARQLMEDVCDELAREIGEDKAEVEELKREHARAREEIEEERRTLQLTEAWREERVQMKLSDAKSELEERCMALDKLKLELEMFLNTHQANGEEGDDDNQGESLRTATEKLKSEASSFMHFLESGTTIGGQFQDDMMSSDDIQSLRLSRDNIRSQSEWAGYTDMSIRDGPKWAINHSRGELGKGITTASDIENESTKILSTFYAYPKAPPENLSWFSPKPISKLAKDKQPNAGLEGKFNYLRFDCNDSGEERSLDEGKEVEDDSDTTWGHNKFGPNKTEKSKWNVKFHSNINGFGDDIDDGGDESGQDRDSGASPSPEFSRRCSRQRGFKGSGIHLNEGFSHAGKKHFNRNLLEFSRPCTDDLDGASSVNGLSSPIFERSGDTLDLNLQREDWPVLPVYGSASQGRRLAIANNAASRRRRNPLQWRKFSGKNGDLQSSTVLEDEKSVLYLPARHRKGPRPSR